MKRLEDLTVETEESVKPCRGQNRRFLSDVTHCTTEGEMLLPGPLPLVRELVVRLGLYGLRRAKRVDDESLVVSES
ncbi:unnamed protein product [Strongylus vulgaris]|uniref:Uncharacterized protein n=1 Tax=Strongylus vulgaris TaxID=40348 RepID=A0A3P7JK27_STRVU|nr:unnamed protein product [Strongylus vulgaris]